VLFLILIFAIFKISAQVTWLALVPCVMTDNVF
jgi:hypothetical protein